MSTDWKKVAQEMDAVFDRNFEERGELGASVSVWEGEEEVISLARGHTTREREQPWTADTLIPVWSATKGPASLCCLLAMEEAEISLHAEVRKVWPEFGQNGKEQLTFAQLLSHTGGLCALDEKVSVADYPAVIHALERQMPLFVPGTQVAYHARTFGFLLDEIVRRLSGANSLGQYFHERIALPLNLDFWIGLPEEQFPRVATLYPGKMSLGPQTDPFLKALTTRGSLTQRIFASPAGLHSVQEMNQPATWKLGVASMGGVGSARALAQFYAMLANHGAWHGRKFVSDAVLNVFQRTLAQGDDPGVCTPMAFSAGMMHDPEDRQGNKVRRIFGASSRAFGHPGAGGSLAFADPAQGIGFAYVMNQMELGVLPGERSLDLVQTLST